MKDLRQLITLTSRGVAFSLHGLLSFAAGLGAELGSWKGRLIGRLIGSCLLAISCSQVAAQAGSRPPQYFNSPQMFYHSLNGSTPNPPGGVQARALKPDGVMELTAATHYLLWVELEQGRLNVLENLGDAGVVLRKRIPVSIGKHGIGKKQEGDNKTPIGIYRITSFLQDAGLDDYYGIGAYPLNYPNALDLLESHSGHGIWLHGLPKLAQQRPFLSSEGCVIIDNQSLEALAGEIGQGATIVLTSHELLWVDAKQQDMRRSSLQLAIDSWRSAWESRNTVDYLGFYAQEFSDLHRNKAQWSDYKTKVNSDKKFIHVDVSEVNMLVEPGKPDVVNVVFQQNYASDSFRWQGKKQQLWRQTDEGWKIIYEGDYF